MYESYFVRKTADNARAREWARLGCAWGGTHKRARAFFVRGRPKKAVLGSIFGSAREAAHRRRQTTIFFRAELNPANSRKPRVRMHDRPLDLRPPASPLVRSPPVTSRRVECRVVAKATVEVGLVIAVLITHVTAARRRASRRVDGAASVGVVIITSAAARCIPFVVRLIWRKHTFQRR